VADTGVINSDKFSFVFNNGLNHLSNRYIANIDDINHTYIGTQCLAASHFSSLSNIFVLIDLNIIIDINHHMSIATTQAIAIIHILSQKTIDSKGLNIDHQIDVI
jgi:hypothetical protein